MASDPVSPPVSGALLEESVEELYEHAPCGYLSTLPDGTIVRANRTVLDWTGHERDALLARTKFQALLTIGSRMYYETHYAPLMRMQGFVNEVALEIVRADGRIVPIVANSRQKRDADGKPLLNRITLFDSTDRRRYERELLLARRRAEQVAKDKADLLAMLSHDIRNPLNALMGVVQLLDRSELTDVQRRYVRLLTSSSESMLGLLNRVLELSRAESTSFALSEAPFELRPVVRDVVSTFAATADQKHLQLQCAVDDRVPGIVIGDPIALRQILTNLVGNALKFTDAGSVRITAGATEIAADAVTLEFAVADTGIGIPADQLESIFDEFTQASYETGVKFGGTGLGLAISRKLLALYGSSIRVVSALGEGATFSFNVRLPLPANASPLAQK